MGVVLSESNVRQDTDAVFRQLFSQYGETVYKTLLERCKDEQMARSMLKDIFKRVYESLRDKDHVDVTALWLKSLVEAELMSKRMLPPPQGGPRLSNPSAAAPPPPPAPPGADSARTQEAAAAQAESTAAKGTAEEKPPEGKKNLLGKKRRNVAAKKELKPLRLASIVLLGLFILFLLWCILGLLMDIQAIPEINFGYDWFNSHVFELF